VACITKAGDRLLRLREIIGDPKRGRDGLVPMSRNAWWAGVRAGNYPAPRMLNRRVARWRESEIRAFIAGTWLPAGKAGA